MGNPGLRGRWVAILPSGPLPTELTKGQGVVVPAEASTGPVNDYLNVPVRFGDEPSNWFVVDTGTSRTSVDPWVSKKGSLEATDLTRTEQPGPPSPTMQTCR
jgi:hypothetical protein